MRPRLELRCSRDLALKLGAVGPESIAHHKQLRDAGGMLVRDGSGWALFWPWVDPPLVVIIPNITPNST